MAKISQNQFDINSLEAELFKEMFTKAETDFDLRQQEVQIKKVNSLANLEKAKMEYMKIQVDLQRLMLEERRLALEETRTKYEISTDLSKKPEKVYRAIGKIPVGLFGEQDKQVVEIMKWAKKLQSVDE